MKGRRWKALLIAALLASGGTTASRAQAANADLEPFQMVRSLQLVQDRIANGDHATLPMQKKLLEMIDRSFRTADASIFDNWRNFQALMIYAMSGGNPATVEAAVDRLDFDESDGAVVEGVLGYLTGDVARARSMMAAVDPVAHSYELAAFVALVKGSVTGGDNAEAGMAMLDEARLLAPGTLVEEAALRRIIALAIAAGDAGRFASASEQYSRRFLRSPYASQFAESFVSGILELRDSELDMERVEAAIEWMTQEQARTVYLRLARRAAIDGDSDLLAFASARASDYAGTQPGSNAARSELYSNISSVTSETVGDVLDRLQSFDPKPLSSSDRALLDAARAVAAEVVAPVTGTTPSFRPSQTGDAAVASDAAGTANELMQSARSKLDAIDKLLEETGQ